MDEALYSLKDSWVTALFKHLYPDPKEEEVTPGAILHTALLYPILQLATEDLGATEEETDTIANGPLLPNSLGFPQGIRFYAHC